MRPGVLHPQTFEVPSEPANVYGVRDLWGSLNPRGFDQGAFLVLKSFIDESYDEKTFVLSCSVGPGSRWEAFESEWRRVLDDWNGRLAAQGRRLLSRYHASDCNGGFNDFTGWDVEEQKELTAQLIAALTTVPMQSVAYTVLLKDVRDAWEARWGSHMDEGNVKVAAYMLTTQFCLLRLGELVWPLNPRTRIAFIHDHSAYDEVMLAAFNYVKYTLKPVYADILSTIAPMSSKECLPLQLADFLAFEFFRDRGGQELRGEANRRRKSLELTLQTGIGVSLRTLTPETIREIMKANLYGA